MSVRLREPIPSDEDYFRIGDISLRVPVSNIEVARHENFQLVSYLRDMHAMRINTGRASLRVDISFRLLVDNQDDQLQALVAMTRTTPFVPIINKYLQGQLQIYDNPPLTPIDQEGETEFTLFTNDTEPTRLEALPMAIMGMSLTMGGDSAEILDCRMTLLYWNPTPWFGIDNTAWKFPALLGLRRDYERYIKKKIENTGIPKTFDRTIFKWWEIRLFNELQEAYKGLLDTTEDDTTPVDEEPSNIRETDTGTGPTTTGDFDQFLRHMSHRVTPDQFVSSIALVESGDDSWQAKNPNTTAAGRWQMTQDTFEAVFFDGADVERPIREMLQNDAVWEQYGGEDYTLRDIVDKRKNLGPNSFAVLRSGRAYQNWYARENMQGVQTLVMEEYAKGLYRKHDNDAVAASLEYFLGSSSAKPYINEWRAAGTIRGWTAADKNTIGANNLDPRQYLQRAFGNFNTSDGWVVDRDMPIYDPEGLGQYQDYPGHFTFNKYGEQIRHAPPTIDAATRNKLSRFGWDQLAVLPDGKPNPDIINPLFFRRRPNEIDVTPAFVTSTENQIITSITVAFQNRFSMLPILGWPYPAMQHMGSVDSEMRVTCVVLSDSEEYQILQQLQSMLHAMDTRSRKYRADYFDGTEIFMMNRVNVTNRLLNMVGIQDVVVTDISQVRDNDSPNLVRAEIIMSESALDPDKEKLKPKLGKNDVAFRLALRTQWLRGERFKNSPNDFVNEIGKRLRALQLANDSAREQNLATWDDSGATERQVIDDAFMIPPPIVTDADAVMFTQPTGRTVLPAPRRAQMFSARVITPHARLLLSRLLNAKVDQFSKLTTVEVPTDPNEILSKGPLEAAENILTWLITKENELAPSIEQPDVDHIKGQARHLLETSKGREIVAIWEDMQKPDLDLEERYNLLTKWLRLWTEAHHEWYQVNILEPILIFLYRKFPDDPTFKSVVRNVDDAFGRRRGIYRDLFLEDIPEVNPYRWLDETLEPELESTIDSVYRGTLQAVDEVLAAYESDVRDPTTPLLKNSFLISPSRHESDDDRAVITKEKLTQLYDAGSRLALTQAKDSIKKAMAGLRIFNLTPFTMRRAFPAYRLYFVEEDNKGIFRRFDDFYNYNAIIDINLVKYKTRPTTCILTLSNLFGHLDAKTFSDNVSDEELRELVESSNTTGKRPVANIERDGKEITRALDGTESPLREVMLKPGTKLVLKLGYDNDPDKLPTVFAGQITEVSTGEIMTVVAQDWTTELLTHVDPEQGVPTAGFFRSLGRYVTSNSYWDIQGTATSMTLLRAIMHHRNVVHFGHWQIGEYDPFSIGYKNGITSYVPRAIASGPDAVAIGAATLASTQTGGVALKAALPLITSVANRGVAQDRSMSNVFIEPIPFYNAFGISVTANYLSKEELFGKTLWELVQLLRLRHPNHIAMVRPYGQGDATLYFGPPYGFYVANEFEDAFETVNAQSFLQENQFEIFESVIREGDTVSLNDLGGVLRNEKVSRFALPILAKFNLIPATSRANTQQIPVWLALNILAPDLFQNAHESTLESFWNSLVDLAVNIQSVAAPGAAGTEITRDILSTRDPHILKEVGALHPGADRKIIKTFWDAIQDGNKKGGYSTDDQRDRALAHVIQAINQVMRMKAYQKAINNPDDPAFELMKKALKPVRKWHLVTSKHHIIANNIVLNSNFANQVVVREHKVSFDPSLNEVRTRYFDQEVPASLNEVHRGFTMTSLLADEIKTMYRGQLLVTGIAEIDPHDIMVIFDDVRHIHGAFEVAKVQHIFNQELGFISIVEPHAIVEVADFSVTAAIQAFMHRLSADVEDIPDGLKFAGSALASTATAATLGPGGPATVRLAKNTINKSNLTTMLALSASAPSPLNTGATAFFAISQMLARGDATDHPLTVCPLIKRGVPWLGGLDGASGQGFIGQFGTKIIKGIRYVRDFIRGVNRFADRSQPGFLDALRDVADPGKDKIFDDRSRRRRWR